jgi:hypothetical protein
MHSSYLPHIAKYLLVMSTSPQKAPQQPKMRSSCDRCGVVKLKCDGKRPECGRCVSQGMTCIYGESRKVGKPPRGKVDRNSSGGGRHAVPEPEPFSTISNSLMSYSWDQVDGNTNTNTNSTSSVDGGVVFNFDALPVDPFGNLHGSSLSAFNSLDFGEWPVTEHLNSTASRMLHSASTDAAPKPDWSRYSAIARTPDQPARPLSDRGDSSPVAIKDHDCHREAHDVLGTSLFADSTLNEPKISVSPPMTPNTTTGVALDHLLLLNRKASERLSSLLACSCASSPYLMMLYASLISATLTRYKHAVGGTLGGSWKSCVSQETSSTDQGGSRTTPTGQSVGPALTPERIAIGAFNVDDHREQSALKIQLLAGEVRKVARLIDQFASYHSDSQYLGGQSSRPSVDGLHQNLSLWLKGEHSRITDMIRTKLRELNS